MKVLNERNEGLEGAFDGVEIKFADGQSTLVALDDRFELQQQVFRVCKLNDVPMNEVSSVQIVRQCLFM